MDFKLLEIQDKEKIFDRFKNNKFSLCVYSPLTILVWRAKYYFPVYRLEKDILYIGANLTGKNSRNHLIIPIAENLDKITPDSLYSFIKGTEFSYFKYVSEEYMDIFGYDEIEKYFRIEEAEGDSDYIYLKENLSELKGRKYSKKRNLINQFLKTYDNRFSFEEITNENQKNVLDFIEEWCIKKNCDKDPDSDIACEKRAVKNAVENHQFLGYKTLVIRIDNEIMGCALSSQITQDTGGLHFQKAEFEIKGLYQFFDMECAKRLFSENIKFINKESDMNEEGLRKVKKSYYPEKILKSFNLYPK
ncbi:MAG: DUF2156 domain-containing protein [Desulfobacteraceae bacterium]|nr:DUF2156 domain-containing protein [Desulfobacteraceae bacterium]